ncbi:hypothetical protein [Desulfosporosinus acidiphilus]|uniref:hypothetical protein n=1 Tax=Desulfosporosinus acidiphilus TaxID=885581 RepID=UPI0013053A4F|nr:hypothetical protein [Desulfosporosinus acidiphilus]
MRRPCRSGRRNTSCVPPRLMHEKFKAEFDTSRRKGFTRVLVTLWGKGCEE